MAYSESYEKWIEEISRSDEQADTAPESSSDAKDDKKFYGLKGLESVKYLYRVLSPSDNIEDGIVCKHRKSPRTVPQHIASGSRHRSRFISTTSDRDVAALWAFYEMETTERKPRETPLRIVKINVERLAGTKTAEKCINLCDKEVREHFIKGATHRSWAKASKEVLFQNKIPKYVSRDENDDKKRVFYVATDISKPPQPPAKKPKRKKVSLEKKMSKLSIKKK